MAKIKFGQYVRLKIESRANALVFETDDLRVDFDIRDVAGWVRAKIEIYNLATETIKKITNGENYATITTSLHGGEETILAKHLYISNTTNEFALPDEITKLFCYSSLKRTTLEKQITINVGQPSLANCMNSIKTAAGYDGEIIYKQFPDGYKDQIPDNPTSKLEGSILSIIETLGKEYRFQQYADGNDIVLMYQVNPKNRSSTSLDEGEGDVILSTNNMRSNPKIGPSTISIHSNLDANIKPASVIDISNILTAGTSVSEGTLEVAAGIIKDSVAGYRKYQIYKIQHKGSNWTGDWSTNATGVAPTQGFTMSNNEGSWFK